MSERDHLGSRLFRFASSPGLTPVIAGAGLVTFLLSLVLQAEESVQVAAGIELSMGGAELTRLMATNFLVWSYFALFVVHLACRWMAAVRADRRPPEIRLADKDRILAEAWRYGVVLEPGDWKSVADRVFAPRFTRSSAESARIYRWRPSVLPLRLWQLGLLLFAAGVVLSTLVRVSSTVQLGEGQAIQAGAASPISRYDWRFPLDSTVPLGPEVLSLDEGAVDLGFDDRMQPRGGVLLRWPVSAKLVFRSGNRERTVIAPAFPPVYANGYLVSLTGVRLGPRIVVERGGVVLVDTFLPLNLVPGHSERDSITLDGVPYTLDFTLTPKGNTTLLESPYRLSLVDGADSERVVASATVGPLTEPLVHEDWRISIPEARHWVTVCLTRDPAMLLVVGGALVTLFGLLAWSGVLVRGWEQWVLVETQGPGGDRLYVGVDASVPARRRARQRLEGLLRRIGD